MTPSILLITGLLWATPAVSAGPAPVDFRAEVLPILEENCVRCHRATYVDRRGRTRKPKAGLRMDGKGWLLLGSEDGEVLVPGNASASSLYSRTVLPPDDPDIMPESGDPLTEEQTEVLRRWIEEGAGFGAWTGEPGPDPLEAPEPTAGARELPPPAAVQPILSLGEGVEPVAGFRIEKLSGPARIAPAQPGSPLLRVDFISREAAVDDEAVLALEPLAGHIAVLDLARTGISDRSLTSVGRMSRLTRLDLRHTMVTDSGIRQLARLPELRSLNLCGTAVSDAAVEQLARIKGLRALYLFDTQVSEQGEARLRAALPETVIRRVPLLPGGSPRAGDADQAGRKRRKKN